MKRFRARVASFFFVVQFFQFASASQLLDFDYTGKTTETNVSFAREKLFQEAAKSIASDLVKEMIGAEKSEKSRQIIQSRVLSQWVKFTPYIKAAKTTSLGGKGYEISVQLKIALEDLKKLLLAQGLLYETDSLPIVVPLIGISDRVEMRSLKPWLIQDGSMVQGPLNDWLKLVNSSLNFHFFNAGFYLAPFHQFSYGAHLGDAAIESERPPLEAMKDLARRFKGQLIIDGDVSVDKDALGSDAYDVTVRLKVLHALNGRLIGELVRRFKTSQGEFRQVVTAALSEQIEQISTDLSQQILEAWQKGSIGARLVQVRVQGVLPYHQVVSLKAALARVSKVAAVKERLFTTEETVFELDVTGSPADILQGMRSLKLGGKSLQVLSQDDQSIRLSL